MRVSLTPISLSIMEQEASPKMALVPTSHTYRQSKSHLVYPIWRTIYEININEANGIADLDTIAAQLQLMPGCPQLARSEVSTALDHMTAEGMLLIDHETASYRLPVKSQAYGSIDTIMDDVGDADIDDNNGNFSLRGIRRIQLLDTCRVSPSRDPYCYECHRAGEVLACAECPHTFHTRCVRPADKLDVPLLPLRHPVPDIVEKTYQLTFDKQYAHVSVHTSDSIERTATNLCLRCRMLQRNAQDLRPLTPVDQLHQMVGFSFNRIRSWIPSDTFSTSEPNALNIPAAYVRLLLPVLMQRPRTVDDIQACIAATGYRSLIDYMIDVLDVVHCIGVLRGTACAEYEAAKYLQLDALHDITEMARCQDCYRHSTRQGSDAQWFVRPCTEPHQLVYAKMPGFSYWPAKVIRQVQCTEGENAGSMLYDVRFFGGNHSRALIAERFVVPDDGQKQLVRSVAIRKALEELAEHKACLERVAVGVDDRRDEELIEAAAFASDASMAVHVWQAHKSKRGRPRKMSGAMANKAVTPTKKAAAATNKKTAATTKNAAATTSRKRGRPSSVGPTVDLVTAYNMLATAAQLDVSTPMHMAGDDDAGSHMQTVDESVAPSVEEEPDRSAGPFDAGLLVETEEKEKGKIERDDSTSAAGPSPMKKALLDDVERPSANYANELIEQLRLKMGDCPPHFVNTAVDILREQIAFTELQCTKYEERILIIKRLQWCAACLKQAEYYCCWCTSYCSSECQKAHWKQCHFSKCRRNRPADSQHQQ